MGLVVDEPAVVQFPQVLGRGLRAPWRVVLGLGRMRWMRQSGSVTSLDLGLVHAYSGRVVAPWAARFFSETTS